MLYFPISFASGKDAIVVEETFPGSKGSTVRCVLHRDKYYVSAIKRKDSLQFSGMEVVKTLSPDMDADAVGAEVNLRQREAAPRLNYSLTAQGGYKTPKRSTWAAILNPDCPTMPGTKVIIRLGVYTF